MLRTMSIFRLHDNFLSRDGETRTPNLLVRSQELYPIELRPHSGDDGTRTRFFRHSTNELHPHESKPIITEDLDKAYDQLQRKRERQDSNLDWWLQKIANAVLATVRPISCP